MQSFRIILTSACLVFASLLPAEAQESFSHYFLMPSLYNPAAAGASGMLSVNGIAGIHSLRGDDPDANAYALTASAPIGPVGLGITASFDKTLLTSTNIAGLQANYAFKLAGGRLSAGLGAAYLGMKYDCPIHSDTPEEPENPITPITPINPIIPISPKTKLKAHGIDMSLGLYYSHTQFWGGISLLHALAPEIDFGRLPSSSNPEDGDETSDIPSANETSNEKIKQKVPRTFVAMGGTTIPLSRKIELMPSAMLRSGGGLTRVELTGRVRFLRILSLGAAWRNAEAATLLAGVEYRGFHAGYSYSHPLSRAWRDAGGHGRHEITAGYSVRLSASKKPATRHKSIRIM